ncbi:MAG: PfkB family carbohydrate kinase [Ruegeria sp.]|uniref:PfkB family carbohydrate kinase n=1 Tax=Ruegeria sp. TaxID=1879320 RepID=UPI00349E5B60
MSPRLLQMSGVVVDLLYSVVAVPAPGEEAIVDGFSIKPGGGFNAMVAAKRAGMDVWYGGALGTGPFARIVGEGLNQEAIPFLCPQDTERDQGCCTVLIDQTGERTFIASDGAEGHATAQALSQVTASGFDWTLLSGYALHYKGSCREMQDWLQSDAPISNLVFDPSPVVSALPADALEAARARATWISANAREAAILTGITDPVEAARALASETPKDGGAVVRDGRNGCVIATDELCERVPAYPVTPVDTNGAGDAHLGSFIARLAQRSNPLDAARYANVAAALSTTKKGPATAPEKEEVAAAMNRKEAV